jgi:hypothetical protein
MERLSDALVQAGFRVTVCTSAPAAHTEAAAPGGVAVVPHRPFFTRLPLSLLGSQIYERRLQKFLQDRREPTPPQAILAFHFAYAAAARRVWPRVPIGFAAGAAIWDWFSSLYRDRGVPAQPIFWAKRLLALPVEREAVHAANAIFVESLGAGLRRAPSFQKL